MTEWAHTAHRGSETTPVTLTVDVERSGTGGRSRCSVTVVIDGVEHVAVEHDAFEALCRVRLELEHEGWLLGVEGARIDVWPSGAARDQGGGLRAYRLRQGRSPGSADLVDVFAPTAERLATVAEQRAAAGAALRAPRAAAPYDDVDEVVSVSGPCEQLVVDRSLRGRLRAALSGGRPHGDERWQIVRSMAGNALQPGEWDEAEALSDGPDDVRLVTTIGADEDGVRWSDLVDIGVDDSGTLRVRRFRRRYVGRTRAHVEVLLDTRAQGQPPTEFRPTDLAALSSQRQVDALHRYVDGLALVPAPAVDAMFRLDRGRVPTGRDDDQGANTTFSGLAGHATYTVLVSGAGHVRITRETEFLSL
ncbi:hypothetical protein DEI99_015400 [Curtobacterium sp. MCLR17_036]|uniref:hypothetical protein n=1 Tax=Curtobacterium sp. MCLR17_036 TaxID=2175620 RepID=UPI000DA790D1|nr:hypothetical protein [Curtobacterium sp. MCLR17_036]WIE64596.1 hypothetical protein DEI99_015400 [Curtobacterium sp. MCLR17_036]